MDEALTQYGDHFRIWVEPAEGGLYQAWTKCLGRGKLVFGHGFANEWGASPRETPELARAEAERLIDCGALKWQP